MRGCQAQETNEDLSFLEIAKMRPVLCPLILDEEGCCDGVTQNVHHKVTSHREACQVESRLHTQIAPFPQPSHHHVQNKNNAASYNAVDRDWPQELHHEIVILEGSCGPKGA